MKKKRLFWIKKLKKFLNKDSNLLFSEIVLITFNKSSWLVVGSLIKLEKSSLWSIKLRIDEDWSSIWLKSFIEICSRKRGELKAELKSAKELSNEEITIITEELTKNFSSKIKLNYKYDESLIGGLVVQVGSTMVDTSIKNKLQQIENRMIEA